MITNLVITNTVKNHWEENEFETIIVAIEEFSELTKELTKVMRGEGNTKNLIEELSDSIIMCQALQILFEVKDIDIKVINAVKQTRLINKIIRGEE